MICPNCNNENPDEAVFCKHCGNKLNRNIICPVCQKECEGYMLYCPSCGTALNAAPPVAPPAKTEDKGKAERIKKSLHLASGIVMMVAVLFALVFAFFIGTFQRNKSDYYSETYTLWYFFGRAYMDLSSAHGSGYALAAEFIPVVLSTIVAAGTLVCVVVFSVLSAVKFGLHFKRENVNYYKYATAAVFSFMLGATLFDCIHSTSTDRYYGNLSGTTVTGMVFCCLLLICSLALKIASVGKDFKKKGVLTDCLSTLAGILCLAFLSGFVKADQAKYTVLESNYYGNTYFIGFFRLNGRLAPVMTAPAFTLSVCASVAQIVLIVLSFVALILHIGNFTNKRSFSFGIAIALAASGIAYLILSVIALEVFNAVATTLPQLRISAYPILAFIASVLYLAASITNKAMGARKAKEKETEEKTQEAE